MKICILDSGPIINLSMNGLLYIFEELKKRFDIKFIITPQVKSEVIDRPIHVQRFEFGAMQVQALLDKKIIELPWSLNIDERELAKKTAQLMDLANHLIKVNNQWINLVSQGEMSCLALSDMLSIMNHETIIGIDERTTRVLGENPAEIEQLMSARLHQRVEMLTDNPQIFKKYDFIRSSEIVFVAVKKGIIHNLSGKKALEALLYAAKYKGAAISFEEIDQLRKM